MYVYIQYYTREFKSTEVVHHYNFIYPPPPPFEIHCSSFLHVFASISEIVEMPFEKVRFSEKKLKKKIHIHE